MATPIIISIPHQLGRAEARRRIEAGFGQIIGVLPGAVASRTERWDGDRLVFSVEAIGQRVSGAIDVLETSVAMEIELRGVLGFVASGLKRRLQKVGQLLLTKR
ncbi:MAG: polyhydroxyalkanoic acid system family protein [Variovorax sp.]|nr:polyhydroxyalkanoic acid system family protein [Variovorax sp.]